MDQQQRRPRPSHWVVSIDSGATPYHMDMARSQ
jgi:hypothetical protein